MKTFLEAFTSLNKSVEMKSSEKSPTSKLSPKRNNSGYRKNNINRYRKSTSIFSSGKRQRTLGDYFSGRADKRQHAIKSPTRPPKTARKCLFERSHHRNTAGLDETSSSSLTYSSNSQRFIDVDIAGHSSRLDIDGRMEIVDLADSQLLNRSENEESEKENSPRLKRTQSGTRSTGSTAHNDEGKAASNLNQATVKEMEYYDESTRDDFSRPEGYYRYLEGDCDERQEKVEYDLDDEDMCWLNIVKDTKSRLAGKLSQDSLEMAIDRLEKVSAHLQLNSIKDGSVELKNKKEEICDDDIFCSICLDDECQNSNVILLCDSCNLAVHQDCYGIPYVPEGQWLCSWCLHKKDNPKEESAPTKKGNAGGEKSSSSSSKKSSKNNLLLHNGDGECCLCPVKGGALKKTSDGRWAHVLCALWIPEVGFENIDYLEPITKLEEVPPARHKLVCSVCKKKDAGACIQCMKRNCYVAFHIMCAQKVGTYMRIEQGSSDPEDSPSSIKKSFYCDQHKPEGAKPFTPMYDDSDEDEEDEDAEERESRQKERDRSKRSIRSRSKVGTKKVKQAKSKTSKSQTAKSTGSTLRPTSVSELPVIPAAKLLEIEEECFGPCHDGSLVDPIYNYWILKRKARNNMPLLKAFYTTLMSNNITEKLGAEDTKAALEGLKDAKKLRNEMEKVRLLLELVRKREKVKLLMIKAHEHEVLMQLHPWNSHLLKLLNNLQMLDKCDIFAQPVSLEQVPGYNKKIDQPMDFSTMREKASDFEYNNFEDFERDFDLMIDNCLKFNRKHTMYYKTGVKLRKQAAPIMKEARNKMMDLSCEPLVDLDDTEIAVGNKMEEEGGGDAIHEPTNEEEASKMEDDDVKLPDLKKLDDDYDDDDRLLEETIGYASLKIKEDDADDDDDDKFENLNVDRKPTIDVGDDDKDKTIINTAAIDVIGRTTDDVKEDDKNEADDTHELSNVDATKLYSFDPRGDQNPMEVDENEDYSDDLIIETISINDEEEIVKSSDQVDEADVERPEAVVPVREIDRLLTAGDPPKVMKKQDILKFLSSLTRLVQSSHEELIARNINMNTISTPDEPQKDETSVTITIKKEMVDMMTNNSRPKSTRKTSSIYRRDDSVLNSTTDGFSKNFAHAKTPLRSFNLDPPRDNSTPFSEVRQAFRSSKNAPRNRSNKKSTLKKSTAEPKEDPVKASSKETSDAASIVSPKKIPSEASQMFSTSEVVATGESRRTSERTKTATHRYLIDDDNILAALMSPSRSRKRKNSTQDGTEEKNRAEDEPPVLSRCPSPIEEEEVRSSTPSIIPFAAKSDRSNFVGDDDDDDFVEPETFATCKHKTYSTSRIQKNVNITPHKSLEPSKKKLKFELEMTPPLLIKTSVDSSSLKPPRSLPQKTPRAQKNCKNLSANKPSRQSKSSTSRIKTFLNGLSNATALTEQRDVVPVIAQAVMPELKMDARESDYHLETSIEMPRLDESVSFPDLSLASTEVVSFTSTYDEDVLVAEESYPDADDPGIDLDKPSISPPVQSQKPNVFYGMIKSVPIYLSPSSSNKRIVDSENVAASCDDASRSSKRPRKELETSRTSSGDASISKETSTDELTAASALLDFTRFCGEDVAPKTPVADSRNKNIFDEFNKLSNAPAISPSSTSKTSSSSLSTDASRIMPSVVLPPPHLNQIETSNSQVPTSSNSSQVEYFSWSEKSEGSESMPRFAGNPEVDSAYSTSSSSSSLISSSPNEERGVP